MKTIKLVNRLRNWIDGDSSHDPLKGVVKPAQPRKSENFMVEIAKRIDSVLQDELFIPPSGDAQVPKKFVVFLNPLDDLLWQNSKRKVLEKSLSEITYKRAVEICKPNSLCVNNISVSLKIDRQLSKNMLQAVAIWDDVQEKEERLRQKAEKTIADPNLYRPKQTPKFYVEVSKNGVYQKELPVFKTMVSIGRGSIKKGVDIPLTGSQQISKNQATMMLDNENKFWLFTQGVNPICVEGKIYEPNSRILILSRQLIKIANYDLRFSLTPITVPAQVVANSGLDAGEPTFKELLFNIGAHGV